MLHINGKIKVFCSVTLQSISQSQTIHTSHCDSRDIYHNSAQLRPLSFREALYFRALRVSYRLLSRFQQPWGRAFIGSCPIVLPSRMTSSVSLIRAAYKSLNTRGSHTRALFQNLGKLPCCQLLPSTATSSLD